MRMCMGRINRMRMRRIKIKRGAKIKKKVRIKIEMRINTGVRAASHTLTHRF